MKNIIKVAALAILLAIVMSCRAAELNYKNCIVSVESPRSQNGFGTAGADWISTHMVEDNIKLVTQMVSDGKGSLINRGEKMELAFSNKRKYLASSPKELFIDSEHLAEDRNNYAELPYGWYLNVNLPNKQKFDVLARLSWVLEIRFPNEWDWVVDGNTEEVSARRSIQETVQGLGDLLRD